MAAKSPAFDDIKAHYYQLFVLLTLYFAQGLPAGFMTQALPAILRQYQVSRVTIGWSGVILIPWGIKFLWSPLVDKYYSAKIGRSRSWILPSQISAIMILSGIAFFDPSQLTETSALLVLYMGLFVLSMIGATQDIATDGLATRWLKSSPSVAKQPAPSSSTHRQNQGNAMQVIGYRGGLMVGGGVLLMSMDIVGWQISFLLMAGLIGLLSIPVWLFQETSQPQSDPVQPLSDLQCPKITPLPMTANAPAKSRLSDYLTQHYGYFWTATKLRAWLGVLLTFKIAEGLASAMVKPMMVDFGASLSEIGVWVSVIGSGTSLVGAGLATAWMRLMSRHMTLVVATVLQLIGIAAYGLIAQALQTHWLADLHWLYAINALEHLFAAFALVAVLTNIMHYTRHEQAGSDFTVQVCLMNVLSGGGHFISGYLVEGLGYPLYYTSCVIIGLISLLPICYWYWQDPI